MELVLRSVFPARMADFSREFGKYLTRIGLKEGWGLSLYSFRHGAADALRRAGYPCITARMVTGLEPTKINADLRLQNSVDIFARVWADFPGASMSFYCGMMQDRRQYMTFHGQDGWLRQSAPFNAPTYGDTALELRSGNDTCIERCYEVQQYALMIENFTASATTGTPFACPLEFSRGNQAMIDAIFKAAKP